MLLLVLHPKGLQKECIWGHFASQLLRIFLPTFSWFSSAKNRVAQCPSGSRFPMKCFLYFQNFTVRHLTEINSYTACTYEQSLIRNPGNEYKTGHRDSGFDSLHSGDRGRAWGSSTFLRRDSFLSPSRLWGQRDSTSTTQNVCAWGYVSSLTLRRLGNSTNQFYTAHPELFFPLRLKQTSK